MALAPPCGRGGAFPQTGRWPPAAQHSWSGTGGRALGQTRPVAPTQRGFRAGAASMPGEAEFWPHDGDSRPTAQEPPEAAVSASGTQLGPRPFLSVLSPETFIRARRFRGRQRHRIPGGTESTEEAQKGRGRWAAMPRSRLGGTWTRPGPGRASRAPGPPPRGCPRPAAPSSGPRAASGRRDRGGRAGNPRAAAERGTGSVLLKTRGSAAGPRGLFPPPPALISRARSRVGPSAAPPSTDLGFLIFL